MQPDPATVPADAGADQSIVRSRRSDVIALSVLIAVIGLVFGIRWYYDNWLSDHDILTQYLIWFGYVGDRLRDFEIPAWMPFESSGTPFAGSPSNGWMFLHVMAIFPLLNAISAFKVLLISLSVTGGFATYFFGRRIGLSPLAAFAGALAFIIGPMLYSATTFRTILFQVITFIPVGLLGVEMAIRAPRWSSRLGWTALAAIALSQMFAIWPSQGILFGSMYLAGWLLYRAAFSTIPELGERKAHLIRSTIVGAITAVFASLISAAAALPVLSLSEQSNIPAGDYSNVVGGDYVAEALSWSQILHDHFSSLYPLRSYSLGAAVATLAILGVVLGGNRFGAAFLAVLTLVFLDLGAPTSLTRPVFNLIPMFEQIHSHRLSGTLPFVFPAVALLAGVGVQTLLESDNRKLYLYRILPLVVIGIALAIGNRGSLSTGWLPLIIALLAAGCVLLPAISLPRLRQESRAKLPVVATALVLALTIAFPFGSDLADTIRNPDFDQERGNLITNDAWIQEIIESTVSRRDPESAGEVLQGLQFSDQPFRYAPYFGLGNPDTEYVPSAQQRMDPRVAAALANGRSTRLGLEQIPGFNAVHLKYYVDYINAMNGTAQDYHFLDLYAAALDGSQLFDMLNVRFVLIPTDLPEPPPIAYTGLEIFRNDLVIVYENPNAFERVWIVHDVQSNNDGEGLTKLADGSADGHVTAFVNGPLPPVTPISDGAVADSATVTDRSQEYLQVRTASSADGLLVISQPYAEGWNAYVDGEQVEILRTNHALQGVPVPAGEHSVELRYESQALKIGLWVTGSTAVAIIGIWVWAFVDARGKTVRAKRKP